MSFSLRCRVGPLLQSLAAARAAADPSQLDCASALRSLMVALLRIVAPNLTGERWTLLEAHSWLLRRSASRDTRTLAVVIANSESLGGDVNAGGRGSTPAILKAAARVRC